MRKIKFRAWIKESQQMAQVDFIDLNHNNIEIYDKNADDIIIYPSRGINLMQFTWN